MSLPTIARLTDRLEHVQHKTFLDSNQGMRQCREAGVAAMRDMILDALVANAEDQGTHALGHDDFNDASHWGQVADWLLAKREEGS